MVMLRFRIFTNTSTKEKRPAGLLYSSLKDKEPLKIMELSPSSSTSELQDSTREVVLIIISMAKIKVDNNKFTNSPDLINNRAVSNSCIQDQVNNRDVVITNQEQLRLL